MPGQRPAYRTTLATLVSLAAAASGSAAVAVVPPGGQEDHPNVAPASPVDNESAASLYQRGTLALQAGKLEQAETLLKQCRKADASFVPARVALARIYLRTYRYDDALQVARRADQNVAEDTRLEAVLGEVYERLDDLDQAKAHFQAALTEL